jgi:hypothetical protein
VAAAQAVTFSSDRSVNFVHSIDNVVVDEQSVCSNPHASL